MKITLINQDQEIGNSILELNFKGEEINYIVLNTIRRIILSYIPIYSFVDFSIKKNSSVYHNNRLMLNISNIPVWNIKNDNIIFKEDDEQSVLKQMTMYINYKNKTNEYISVTTDDAKFYYNGEQIVSPYKTPIEIVKLKLNQEIHFNVITKLGIEKIDAIYSPVSRINYKENSNHDFDLYIESRGQIDEYTILDRTMDIIIFKLQLFEKFFSTKEFNNNLTGKIEIKNEDHTFGNLLVAKLQDLKEIKFAGYNIEHPLDPTFTIHYSTYERDRIKKALIKSVDYYIALFTTIKEKIKKTIN